MLYWVLFTKNASEFIPGAKYWRVLSREIWKKISEEKIHTHQYWNCLELPINLHLLSVKLGTYALSVGSRMHLTLL